MANWGGRQWRGVGDRGKGEEAGGGFLRKGRGGGF